VATSAEVRHQHAQKPATIGGDNDPGAEQAARALVHALDRLHSGGGGGREVVAAFRATRVLVLLADGDVRAVERDGLRWVLAFSDEPAIRGFLAARDEHPSGLVDYLVMYGRRLLDDFLPAADAPTGVALDLGSDRPMLFPPTFTLSDTDEGVRS
jgi:SseB protein N-terminal domain